MGRGRSRGKHFETYVWTRDGQKKEVEIRVRGSGEDTEFYAEIEELDVKLKSKTPAELPALIDAALEKLSGIKWEPYVWVRATSSDGSNAEHGTSIDFGFTPIVIGKNAEGTAVWKRISFLFGKENIDDDEHGDDPIDADQMLREGKLPQWNGSWKDRYSWDKIEEGEPESPFGEDEKASLIPASKENVEALFLFAHQMNRVAAEIRRLFGTPRNALGTLSRVRTGKTDVPLLMGPSREDP